MRRVLKWVGIILGLLIVLSLAAVLTYRSWLGMALRPIAARYEVQFKNYSKLPEGKFALTEVNRTNENFDLHISRIEGFSPDRWYRLIQKKGTNQSAENVVELNGWKVVIHDRTNTTGGTARSNSNESIYDAYKKVEKYIQQFRRYVPKATLLNGTVEYKKREYTFPVITWADGKLDCSGVWPISAVPIEIKGNFTGDRPYQLYYAMTPLDLRARFQMWETNDLLSVKINGGYKEATINGTADFGHRGILPLRAKLNAPDFRISAGLLRLEQYQDITGNLSWAWNTNAYKLNLQAHAEPLVSAGTNFPPADIEVVATGNTNLIRIEKLTSTAPGLEAKLSAPIELSYGGKMLSEEAEINLNLDLTKIPISKMKGSVDGKILLRRGGDIPDAILKARGTNLSGYDLRAEKLELSGTFQWPEMREVKARIDFGTNSYAQIEGGGNLKTRTLTNVSVQIAGQIATNLLPTGYSYDSVALRANLDGAVSNLFQKVELELRRLSTPQTPPMNLDASWSGHFAAFEDFMVRAQAGPAVLVASGSGSSENGKTNIDFRILKLSKGDEVYLTLEKPFHVSLSRGAGNSMIPVVEISPLQWRGTNKSLRLSGMVHWPKKGEFDVAATNINPELIQYFVKRSLSGVEFADFSSSGRWEDGPLYGNVKGEFSIEQELFKRISTRVDLELKPEGVSLTEFKLSEPQGEIAQAHGSLPLVVNPTDPARVVHLSSTNRIEFSLDTVPNEIFWNQLTNLTGIKVTNAAAKLEITGTVQQPKGSLDFKANSVQYLKARRRLPFIGPLDIRITLNEQIVSVPSSHIRIEDQPMQVHGEVALGTNFWTQRREEIARYLWDNAEVKVEAPEVHVAPFVEFLPMYLAPDGTIKVDAGMKPGQQLVGSIGIRGIQTRPIPKVGVVQDIEADLNFSGKKIKVKKMQGVIGGETLFIAGELDISKTNLEKGFPGVNLKIQGMNLPLARNPDIILRSDLDLTVRNSAGWVPVIDGNATLRDSFLLRDIQTLAPGRVTKPSRRPPYFSIEQEPIRDWRLNVAVRGDNFMRVRSPFFQGQVFRPQ